MCSFVSTLPGKPYWTKSVFLDQQCLTLTSCCSRAAETYLCQFSTEWFKVGGISVTSTGGKLAQRIPEPFLFLPLAWDAHTSPEGVLEMLHFLVLSYSFKMLLMDFVMINTCRLFLFPAGPPSFPIPLTGSWFPGCGCQRRSCRRAGPVGASQQAPTDCGESGPSGETVGTGVGGGGRRVGGLCAQVRRVFISRLKNMSILLTCWPHSHWL